VSLVSGVAKISKFFNSLISFLKNPSKLKNFPVKEVKNLPIPPLPGYAPVYGHAS